ncbi:MAG: DUF4810 domain-containing protein [Rikenellaceae bacterium]|jgi:hypothetical protein|nr:DUF4810 domain-containing protein [Rikenellaceae bacterium]
MRKFLLLTIIALGAVSCATQTQLYNWAGYDNAVYAYTKTSDAKSTESLMAVYRKLIDNSGGSRKVPPPGVCADYGFLLIQGGKTAEGKALLAKETTLYPESKKFIDRILERFER